MFDPSRARRRLVSIGIAALVLACGGEKPPPATPADGPALEEAPPIVEATEAAPSEPAASEPDAASATETPPTEVSAARPKDTRGKEEIQQVIASNREKLRACYEAALAQNPGIAGDLVIDFTIDPQGAVKTAEVNWSQSEIHVPELDTCAVEAVRSLVFPASSRGLESKVSYPFNFNPPRNGPPSKAPPSPSRR